jgi:hypothetical protein
VLIKRAAVGRSEIHGWGLLATEWIGTGAVADESPILVTRSPIPREFDAHVYWLRDGRAALPCGDGIFTNHCEEPNARVRADLRRRLISLIALRDIGPGEEVTIDYGEPVL